MLEDHTEAITFKPSHNQDVGALVYLDGAQMVAAACPSAITAEGR